VGKPLLSYKKCSVVFVGLLFVAMQLLASMSVGAATSIPKPAVPEFTVKLVDSSYDIPTTYSIDPYTGENMTHLGSHVERRTIEFKIKTQPFTPFWVQESPSAANWSVNFYYNIRVKGHFSEHWTEMFLASDGYPSQDYESDYRVLSYQGEYSSTEGMKFNAGSIMTSFPPGAQVDFQVEAMIGYVSREYAGNYGPFSYPWVFTGETSGWSNTQTITITDSTPTTTPNTSPFPSTPQDTTTPTGVSNPQTAVLLGLDWIQLAMLALLTVIAGLLVAVIVYLRKKSTKGNHQR
jgi:hypothetical protein